MRLLCTLLAAAAFLCKFGAHGAAAPLAELQVERELREDCRGFVLMMNGVLSVSLHRRCLVFDSYLSSAGPEVVGSCDDPLGNFADGPFPEARLNEARLAAADSLRRRVYFVDSTPGSGVPLLRYADHVDSTIGTIAIAGFAPPVALTVAPSGNLVVAFAGQDDIVEFVLNCANDELAPLCTLCPDPQDAANALQQLFGLAPQRRACIHRYGRDGAAVGPRGWGHVSALSFHPVALVTDRDANLWILEETGAIDSILHLPGSHRTQHIDAFASRVSQNVRLERLGPMIVCNGYLYVAGDQLYQLAVPDISWPVDGNTHNGGAEMLVGVGDRNAVWLPLDIGPVVALACDQNRLLFATRGTAENKAALYSLPLGLPMRSTPRGSSSSTLLLLLLPVLSGLALLVFHKRMRGLGWPFIWRSSEPAYQPVPPASYLKETVF
eukprot:m.298992 g.298992  ORF g.298992 m.298992 type:complete len:438 (+) comp14008_c0_seq1:118-1431(+)